MARILDILILIVGFFTLHITFVVKDPVIQAKRQRLFARGNDFFIYLKDEATAALFKSCKKYFERVGAISFSLYIILHLCKVYLLDTFLSFCFVISLLYAIGIEWFFHHPKAVMEMILKNQIVWILVGCILLVAIVETFFGIPVPELSIKPLLVIWHISFDYYWEVILVMILFLLFILYVGYWMIFAGLVLPLIVLVVLVKVLLKRVYNRFEEAFKVILYIIGLILAFVRGFF